MNDDTPRDCTACSGTGRKRYGNTSTWRRSWGANAITVGQCDTCWGSGSASEPWPSVRELKLAAQQCTQEKAAEWLATSTGANWSIFRDAYRELVSVIGAQDRRHKLPDGLDVHNYGSACRVLASALRDISDAAERRRKGTT